MQIKKIIKKTLSFPFRWYARRSSDFLTSQCLRLIAENKIGYVDVGASGGLEPRWEAFKPLLKVFAFEPDQRSRENLEISKSQVIFDVALSHAEGNRDFYLCKTPQVSSMLKPNIPFLELFPNVGRFEILKTISFKASTLDKCLLPHQGDVDFIKLDTQGSELEILHGGQEILNSAILGLEIEIEFFQLYQDQPVFNDVVTYLREKDFQFIDFTNLQRWGRYQHSQVGQCVFCDGLFLRTPEAFVKYMMKLPTDQKKSKAIKYIAILVIYHRADLLKKFMDIGGKSLLNTEQNQTVEMLISHLEQSLGKIDYAVGLFNTLIKFVHPRLQLKIFV